MYCRIVSIEYRWNDKILQFGSRLLSIDDTPGYSCCSRIEDDAAEWVARSSSWSSRGRLLDFDRLIRAQRDGLLRTK